MGLKGKKSQEQIQKHDHDHSSGSCCDSEDEVEIEEKVEQKIKQLGTLKEKVQAIAVNGYLVEKRKLDQELQKQQEAVERKFRETFKPYIDEINNIVQGKHKFTDSDFQEIGQLLTQQEQETKHNYFTEQKISQFWLKVFMNSDVIGQQVEERDEPLLKHLQKIEAGKSEDFTKLWVDFYFSQNQWFSNDHLHKQFELDNEVIKKSFGDQIKWKDGKNITVKIVKKKNKKKGGEKKTKQVKEKSFFNFFLDIEMDSDEEEDENEEDQDVQDLELQYETAQAIYQEILPKSLEYYLGLIETIDDYENMQGNEEDDDEEDDDSKKKKKKIE